MCESSVYFSEHLTLVCSRDVTKQIVILKIKASQHQCSCKLQWTYILWYYDAMPTALTLFAQYSNVYDQITVLICRQMICCETLLHSFSFHHPYLFFCIYHERNQVWNWYGRMKDCLPFHSWNLRFHCGIFHIPYWNFHSILFHFRFHSIPCPASCPM